jgi:hypothetical protein
MSIKEFFFAISFLRSVFANLFLQKYYFILRPRQIIVNPRKALAPSVLQSGKHCGAVIISIPFEPEIGKEHGAGSDDGKNEIKHERCECQSLLNAGDNFAEAFYVSEGHEHTHTQAGHNASEESKV